MKNLRRIVTGHNEAGKSIIMIDGKPSRTVGEDVGGLFEIWNTDGKAINSFSNKDLADIDIILSPIENGTKFRYFAIHPTPDGIPKEKLEAAAALAFEKLERHMKELIPLSIMQCTRLKQLIILYYLKGM